MGTLWSELGPLTDEGAVCPRVYADANVPAGVVTFMRVSLGWDVLFVIEHDDLRRARESNYRPAGKACSRARMRLSRI